DVLIFIDWVEILRLIKPGNRDLEIILVVDIALVQQKLATHHAVARKSVSGKFQAAKGKLLALLYRYFDVDDAFIWIRRIFIEFRFKLGVILHETLRAISLFEVFVNGILKALAIGNFALFKTDKIENLLFGKDRIAFDLQLAYAEDLPFGDR